MVKSVKSQRAKYTFRQDTVAYQIWHIVIVLVCLYTSIIYPYYNMAGFPGFYESGFWILVVAEAFFFIEMIVNFFK